MIGGIQADGLSEKEALAELPGAEDSWDPGAPASGSGSSLQAFRMRP
jgi:hypothetical protein